MLTTGQLAPLDVSNFQSSLWSTTFNLHLEGDTSFRLYLTLRPSPAALALLGNMYMYRQRSKLIQTNPTRRANTTTRGIPCRVATFLVSDPDNSRPHKPKSDYGRFKLFLPRGTLRRDAGQTTSAMGCLKFFPKFNVWRESGQTTPSMGWLK